MPTKVRLELDPAQVQRAKLAPMVAPFVYETTRQVLNRARVLTPVDTGNLRASEDMTTGSRRAFAIIYGQVYTKVKYAEAVHEGTKPHIIRANKAKALAFYWGKIGAPVIVPKGRGATFRLKDGTLIIGKGYVNHPGTKARPYFRRALEQVAATRGFIVVGGTASTTE